MLGSVMVDTCPDFEVAAGSSGNFDVGFGVGLSGDSVEQPASKGETAAAPPILAAIARNSRRLI